MPRRLSFWLAVGGVAILSNAALEIAAARFPIPGLARLAALTHAGASQ